MTSLEDTRDAVSRCFRLRADITLFAPERYLSEMRKILLPAEAGKMVRRDRRTIIDWIKRRGCPARALPSGQYILFEDEFIAWLQQQGCRFEMAYCSGFDGAGEAVKPQASIGEK
jgi:hypothetical protein